MNGYSLTDRMRKTRQWIKLTAIEQALFYELLAICNEKKWREEFQCSNAKLTHALNISENTLIKSRETLIKAGLLNYQSGKSNHTASSYSFTTANTTVVTTANQLVPTTANERDYININSFKTPSIPNQESESIKDRLLADERWKKHTALQSGMGIAFLQILPAQLESFFQYITATGEEHTVQTLSDAKRRFFWWWNKLGKKTYESKNDTPQTYIW